MAKMQYTKRKYSVENEWRGDTKRLLFTCEQLSERI